MTEEIIIDGVNVKDCKRRIGKNNLCRYFKRNCADNNYNCIWKKCLRLQAENEELKQEYKQAHEDFICSDTALRIANTELDELEQENERLKENYRLSCLKCEYKNTKADVDKYRKALEEIREMLGSQVWAIGDDVTVEEIRNKIDKVLKDERSRKDV